MQNIESVYYFIEITTFLLKITCIELLNAILWISVLIMLKYNKDSTYDGDLYMWKGWMSLSCDQEFYWKVRKVGFFSLFNWSGWHSHHNSLYFLPGRWSMIEPSFFIETYSYLSWNHYEPKPINPIKFVKFFYFSPSH